MRARQRFVSIIVTLLITAGLAGPARAEPLRIGYAIWVGFGPLFVAQEKGLFAKEGVEIELIPMALPAALHAGLLAGQIDVSTAAVDDMLLTFDPKQPYAVVMVTDNRWAVTASSPPRTSGRSPISRVSWSRLTSAPSRSFS
jgi:NitT/TauT family transport system substrate-binding protein